MTAFKVAELENAIKTRKKKIVETILMPIWSIDF